MMQKLNECRFNADPDTLLMEKLKKDILQKILFHILIQIEIKTILLDLHAQPCFIDS